MKDHTRVHKKNSEQQQSAILNFLNHPDYKPMRSRDIAAKLGIPSREFSPFRQLLGDMILAGLVQRRDDRKWLAVSPEDLPTGRLDVARAGHAFLVSDNPDDPDVFIPQDRLNGGLDGDRVAATVFPDARGWAGTVVRILERGTRRLVAVMLPDGRAKAEDPRNACEFVLAVHTSASARSAAQKAQSMRRAKNENRPISAKESIRLKSLSDTEQLPPAGLKVLVEITAWPGEPGGPRADILEILGPAGDPDTETAAILAAHEVVEKFPPEVLRAANAFGKSPTPADYPERLDLTEEAICTIDPRDARDFDDALSCQALPDGGFKVGVHIADVAFYVQPGSILDTEARVRSTSIYLPERVIPMLPEELSNDLCSLRPNEIRPAKTVFIHYSAEGERIGYSIHRSLIRSRTRFSYEDARDLITGARIIPAVDPEVLTGLMNLNRLAEILRKKRIEDGSIELNLAEYKVIIDPEGHAVAMERVVNDFSHHLVEEFMLAANCAVAEWAALNGLPILHRVHAPPKEDRVEELSTFLTASGYPFKPPFQRKKLTDVINKVRGRPEEHSINLMILKSFQQACYAPESDIGHFALNFPRYAHFTSPIRRYPDLYLHQMLDRVFPEGAHQLPKRLRKLKLEGREELAELGAHTSGRERRAMRVEESVKDFRRMELLASAKQRDFSAVVTGIQKFGIFVEIEDFFVEGMLHRTVLEAKGYAAREDLPKKNTRAGGPRAIAPGFHLGQVVRVRVKNVDLAARRCEMEFLGTGKG